MRQIIFFFIRNKNFLLFLLLLTVSLFLTVNSHSFHKNKIATSANFFSGGLYSAKQYIMDYFSLKEQNAILVEENKRLRESFAVEGYRNSFREEGVAKNVKKFEYVAAGVINNSYSKTKNFLTLNKGKNDSIRIDMGVISSKGVVGIVNSISSHYATVQSLLNTTSQINAKLKNTEHFGSLIWRGENPYEATLIEIPRQVKLAVGDTIVTGGKSTIFPEDIPIGAISNHNLASNEDYYELTITLFNDMTSIRHVYVIENTDAEEILLLEKETEDAEQ